MYAYRQSTLNSLAFADLLGRLRHDLEQVPHHAEVGELEDGRLVAQGRGRGDRLACIRRGRFATPTSQASACSCVPI